MRIFERMADFPSSSSSSNKWWLMSIALVILISYVLRQRSIEEKKSIITERLFTANELQSYTKDELYLAILGIDSRALIERKSIG